MCAVFDGLDDAIEGEEELPAAKRPETQGGSGAAGIKPGAAAIRRQSTWARAKDALAVTMKLRAILNESREELDGTQKGPPVVKNGESSTV
jgi:hypothetical protein